MTKYSSFEGGRSAMTYPELGIVTNLLRKTYHIRFLIPGRCFHKFTTSYNERNAQLATKSSDTRYPMLSTIIKAPRATPFDIHRDYREIEHTKEPGDVPQLQVLGRIDKMRYAGRGLLFVDVIRDGVKLQFVANSKKANFTRDEIETHGILRPGDSVSGVGWPWRTSAGELSLLLSEGMRLLSPCLHPYPNSSAGETIRQHNRVAEYKAFKDAKRYLEIRSIVLTSIHQYLVKRNFLQVQTPIISSQRGGASADPFNTRCTALGSQSLSLRVAPELWLKRLVIGGFDRVYEIGPSFRNEGIDATHNPEFTTCELYSAFTTLEELIDLTEDLFKTIASEVWSRYPEMGPRLDPLMCSRWGKMDFVDTIESQAGTPLPHFDDLEGLRDMCSRAGLPTDGINTRLLDRLAAHYIEPLCINPTFIMQHPAVMAPLAKHFNVERNGCTRTLSRRFELIINKNEYVNAYEEENDPNLQLAKLRAQAMVHGSEDQDIPDKMYIKAMEWGLPPTSGWGVGIDRLVMLLSGATRIQQVLAFGGLHQLDRQ